eukprot:scaffold549_cov174-Ochromonas_danica.AAC.21
MDLFNLFSHFGQVSEINLHLGSTRGRSTSYAFVSLTSVEAIEVARKHLDGFSFLGRKLRVRRATIQHAKSSNNAPMPMNSLHVRFATRITNQRVTEFDLVRIFSPFGLVEDVLMKESNIDAAAGRQKGYAFLYFVGGHRGLQSALMAAKELNGMTVQGLTLWIESTMLLKQQDDIFSVRQSHLPYRPAYHQYPSYPNGQQSFPPSQTLPPPLVHNFPPTPPLQMNAMDRRSPSLPHDCSVSSSPFSSAPSLISTSQCSGDSMSSARSFNSETPADFVGLDAYPSFPGAPQHLSVHW